MLLKKVKLRLGGVYLTLVKFLWRICSHGESGTGMCLTEAWAHMELTMLLKQVRAPGRTSHFSTSKVKVIVARAYPRALRISPVINCLN